MVGITKRAAINRKKTKVAMCVKKQKNLFKKKDAETLSSKVVEDVVEDMDISSPVQEIVQKKKNKKLSKKKQQKIAMNAGTEHRNTVVRDDKLKRENLPLKETSLIKAPPASGNAKLVCAQHISKKRAKKILKAQKRVQKEKEARENQMQE